jgi:hypothetical protein
VAAGAALLLGGCTEPRLAALQTDPMVEAQVPGTREVRRFDAEANLDGGFLEKANDARVTRVLRIRRGEDSKVVLQRVRELAEAAGWVTDLERSKEDAYVAARTLDGLPAELLVVAEEPGTIHSFPALFLYVKAVEVRPSRAPSAGTPG